MGTLEQYAVKTAEAHDVAMIGVNNANAATVLYGVMAKEAEFSPDGSNPFRMCRMMAKFASDLGKPTPDAVTQLKVAAAVAVDDTFKTVLDSGIDNSEKTKVAEMQAYGREYIAELLRGVI
jgi:hypothetical protein